MCDYSLQHVASRPARVGEKLVSTTFANTFTRGFAAAEEPAVAVCLLPGTEVAFEHDVHYDPEFHLFFSSRRMTARVARFRQINTDQPHAHHDALEFPNGQIVLLTRLIPGQKAVVLQLPGRRNCEAGAGGICCALVELRIRRDTRRLKARGLTLVEMGRRTRSEAAGCLCVKWLALHQGRARPTPNGSLRCEIFR